MILDKYVCADYIVVKIFLEIKSFSKWLVFIEFLKLTLVMLYYFSEAGDRRSRGAGHSFCFYDFVQNISVMFKFRLPDFCVVLYFKT